MELYTCTCTSVLDTLRRLIQCAVKCLDCIHWPLLRSIRMDARRPSTVENIQFSQNTVETAEVNFLRWSQNTTRTVETREARTGPGENTVCFFLFFRVRQGIERQTGRRDGSMYRSDTQPPGIPDITQPELGQFNAICPCIRPSAG